MKKRFMLYLFVTIALTSSIITLLIGAHSKSIIGAHIENVKNDIASRLENQFCIYDNFLLIIENDLKEKAKAAMISLVSQFPDYEVTLKPSPEELKKIADAAGVDEIYFINKDCAVYNTSFKTDMNLSLKGVPDFAPFVKSVFGRNEAVFHRISNSTLTGNINLYGYIGPKNADYIIEISISINKYLDKVSPDFWRKAVKNIFHSQLKYSSYLRQIDIFIVGENSIWSFINIGKTAKLDKLILDRIAAEKEVRVAHNDSVTVYKQMAFENKFESWLPMLVILEMNFDFGVINKFGNQIILYSFLVCFVIILISFVISSKILNNYITKRIININDALKRVAEGDYSVSLKDAGDDEITEIASNVNAISETISKHVNSLEDMIPICASCKKIRDDKGFWQQVEGYLSSRSGIKFSHGMCPECTKQYYPEYYAKKMESMKARQPEEQKPQDK